MTSAERNRVRILATRDDLKLRSLRRDLRVCRPEDADRFRRELAGTERRMMWLLKQMEGA